MKLSGWGRYPVLDARTHRPRSVEALRQLVLAEPNLIARGNGRAYGDSAINTAATIETRHLNRMIGFDSDSGQLVAEAGVLLGDIITAFLPSGWFPLVTPGTKFVTLGGAIAGLGGACLSLYYPGSWNESLSSGQGLIAVALVIFARWRPVACLWAALLFGGAGALGPALQSVGVTGYTYLFNAVPYALTLLILVLTCSPHRSLRGAPGELSVQR